MGQSVFWYTLVTVADKLATQGPQGPSPAANSGTIETNGGGDGGFGDDSGGGGDGDVGNALGSSDGDDGGNGALDGYKNCSPSELIDILIGEFLPDLYEKYVSLNVQYTSGHKGYAPTIPRYMVNRPAPLVLNMLTKMSKVTDFMLEHVHAVSPSHGVFEVQSCSPTSNEKTWYTVW